MQKHLGSKILFYSAREEERRQNPPDAGTDEQFYGNIEKTRAEIKIPRLAWEVEVKEVEVRILEFAIAEWEKWMRE